MTPDPILAALGGNITAARTLLRKRDGRYFSPDEHAIYDLALRALDAMEAAEAVMRPFSDEDHRRLAHDIAALGGNIPEARKTIAASLKGLRPSFWTATGNLALRALDAMERPAGGDAKLRRLRTELCRHTWAFRPRSEVIDEIDRLLSEPSPASDGRTGSCAECERLNADVLAYRRKERKILGLPDEALAEDHIDAITSLKNDKDGWEAECEMQRVTKERIIAERDEARAECERLAMELAAAHGILDATLGVLPVGNLATHTRDSIPDRVQGAMEQWGILGRVDDILMDAGFVFGDATTAADLVRELIRERDEAQRDAKNAADLMLVANNEAVRYMRERDAARAECERLMAVVDHIRDNYVDGDKAGDHEGVIQCVDRLARERDEARQSSDTYERACTKALDDRDAARADQAAMARRELEAFGSDALNLRALPADAPVQVVRDIIAEKLRARIAALPAEKPTEPADAVKIAEWPVLVAEQARLLGEIENLRQAVAPERDRDWPNGQFSTETTVDFAIRLLRYHGGIPLVAEKPAAPAPIGGPWGSMPEPNDDPSAAPADAEARIAAWERHAMSGFDPHHDAVVVLAPSEVDTAAALMRSLAAVAAKAQAEVERLRADVDACRRAYSAHWVDDYDTAQECMAAAVDSAMILRGKIAEAEQRNLGADSFRAKLREELAMASKVEADLRTQLVVMENNLVRSLRGGGK